MRRLVAVAATLALLGSACGLDTESEPRTIPSDEVPFGLLAPAQTTTTTTEPPDPVPGREFQVFLVNGDNDLVAAPRTLPADATVGDLIRALLEGANDDEADSGLRSLISPETRLRGVSRRDPQVAVIDLSSEFAVPQGEAGILAVAQVVFTATQLTTVTGVIFSLDGTEIEAPRGNGTLTKGPLTRFLYQKLLPPEPTTTTTSDPPSE